MNQDIRCDVLGMENEKLKGDIRELEKQQQERIDERNQLENKHEKQMKNIQSIKNRTCYSKKKPTII